VNEDEGIKLIHARAARRRVYAVAFFSVLLWLAMSIAFALVAVLALASFVTGAPAPLPRREGPPPALPRPPGFCRMIWAATAYRTSFNADGSYLAVGENGGGRWAGFWHVTRGGESGAYLLNIKERSSEGFGWIEWGFPLLEASGPSGTRTTAGLAAEVRLELTGGRPDQ
jgi:hypothetical protein